MALLDDIGAYLDTQTVSTADLVLGTNLFLSNLPDSPDTCVTVYHTTGSSAGETFGSSVPLMEYAVIQVVARAESFSTAESLARDLYTLLAGLIQTEVNSVLYHRVAPRQAPFPLERDDQNRMVFVCNYDVTRATP